MQEQNNIVIGPISESHWLAMRSLRKDVKTFANRKPTKANAMFLWRAQSKFAGYLKKYVPNNPYIEEFSLDR